MTVEGRVTGPLSNPDATVHASAGAVRAPSTSPMPADVTLTLKSGRLEMAARAPVWSATIDGQIATEAPHDFSARLSIAGLDAAWVQALTGAWGTGYVPDGAISATIDAAGSVGSRTLRVGGRATLADGSLSVGGSRLIDGVDASIETRDGRLWLTRFAGRGFGGPISASGDLPLNWIAEYLPEGWRLDQTPAASKPASFALRAEPDLETLGTWLRPEEPGRITGGLTLRVTGTASAPSAEAIDARLVVEPGTVTIRDVPFTLARAATVAIEARAGHHRAFHAHGTSRNGVRLGHRRLDRRAADRGHRLDVRRAGVSQPRCSPDAWRAASRRSSPRPVRPRRPG